MSTELRTKAIEKLKGDQIEGFKRLEDFLKGDKQFMLIRGVGGSGKSTLITDFIRYYLAINEHCRIACTATTNAAVKVLNRKINIKDERLIFSTIHKRLGLKEQVTDFGERLFVIDTFNNNSEFNFDFVMIDECSMISNYVKSSSSLSKSVWQNILTVSAQNKTKIIFVGDFYQIPPVNEDECVLAKVETITEFDIQEFDMNHVLRQAMGSPIIKAATHIREHIRYRMMPFNFSTELTDMGNLRIIDKRDSKGITDVLKEFYCTTEYKDDNLHVKTIAYHRNAVLKLNKYIRSLLFPNSNEPYVIGDKLIADQPIIEYLFDGSRNVLFTTSDEFEVIGVKKDKVVIKDLKSQPEIRCYKLTVKMEVFDDDDIIEEIIVIDPVDERYYNHILNQVKQSAIEQRQKYLWRFYYKLDSYFAHIDYANSLTAHKSQGSTFNTAIISYNDILENRSTYERNRILYTAFTRPTNNLIIIK